jgi:hypothetical protein
LKTQVREHSRDICLHSLKIAFVRLFERRYGCAKRLRCQGLPVLKGLAVLSAAIFRIAGVPDSA